MLNNKWNGRQYGLDKFTNLHRTAYVALEEAALHVNFQLPNEHTRVGYIIENIVNTDPALQAAISSIRANTNNMRDNFERAVAFLLPTCPYAKHLRNLNSNGNHAIISDTTLRGQGSTKTGVDLRWHTVSEYKKLTKEQRKELYEWQQSNAGRAAVKAAKKKLGSANKKITKKQLQSEVASLKQALADKERGSD